MKVCLLLRLVSGQSKLGDEPPKKLWEGECQQVSHRAIAGLCEELRDVLEGAHVGQLAPVD